MRSMFEVQAFGGRGVPSYTPPSLGMVRLAQADTTTPVPPAATTPTPPESDVTGLSSGIEGLLKQLPAEVLGTYNAKYQQCQTQLATGGAVGLAAGGKCLVQLYDELKNFLKNGPPKPPPAPASDFPVVPVLIGGLGFIVLIWGLSKL